MALKDLIDNALQAAESETRRQTLSQVLELAAAAKADYGDSEIFTALSKLITDREQKAGQFNQTGQTTEAAAERSEIGALREILRQSGAATAPAPKKSAAKKTAAHAVEKPKDGPISRRQIVMAAVAGVVLIAAAVAYILLGRNADTSTGLQNAGPQKLTLYADDMTMGSPNAPVTVLEYAAPSCPHCAHFNETVIPNLKRDYIDTGKVRYVLRVFPISPADGAVEGIARACLPKENYFQFMDLMFRNQEKWDPENGITDVRGGIISVAKIAGLSPAQVDQCMADAKSQERLNRNASEAQKKYDLNGVPDIIINGELWRAGGATWEELKEKLDTVLAKK
ncbi:MAG: thioredoxin domain-containing protein [Rhizomicrobium sp.]